MKHNLARRSIRHVPSDDLLPAAPAQNAFRRSDDSMTDMVCPDVIKRLIERFDQQLEQPRSPNYNERCPTRAGNLPFAAMRWICGA